MQYSIELMDAQKSTEVRFMVFKEHPDFNILFEDPMFALIFRSNTYNSYTRLIFCEETIQKCLAIQMIHLDFIPDITLSPVELLLNQLNKIKSWVCSETTTALQFSAVCRELLCSKSRHLYDCIHEKDESIAHRFKSFEFRYHHDMWVETNFCALVATLSKFVLSNDSVVAKIKHGDETQVLANKIPNVHPNLLWVKDDGSIMVLTMPDNNNNNADTQYSVDSSSSSSGCGKSYDECRENSMFTKTWSQMFGSIPGADCSDAGVVFFIKNDVIRYIYHRNVNAFDSNWKQCNSEPVYCCTVKSCMSDNLRGYWHQSSIETRIKKTHISNGYNLRYMIETIADSVDREMLVPCPRLILYIFLSVIILKYRYSFCNHFGSRFYATVEMFKPDKLKRMLEVWTCFIAGQEIAYRTNTVRHMSDTRHRVHEIELNDVVRGGDKAKRLVSWQFIPEDEDLHVFDTFRPYENGYALLSGDKVGNPYDLRTRLVESSSTKTSDLLLRIDTFLI
jgi:hypothetical protein